MSAKSFLKQHYLAIVVFILASAVAAVAPHYGEPPAASALTSEIRPVSATDDVTVPQPRKSENNIQLTADPKPSKTVISATLSVPDKTYLLELPKQSTVYYFMKLLAEETDFSFSGKNHSALGFFVESINGKQQNPRAGEYWIYSINGKKANVGISAYVIQPNDVISWSYEKEE